jgi:DHA1 family vesicular acetylcholine transporter-like MFS transporter 3
LGWHAPFIFCIIVCALDLIARLFVIERKQLVDYDLEEKGKDPSQTERAIEVEPSGLAEEGSTVSPTSTLVFGAGTLKRPEGKQLSPWGVLAALAKSKRGMVGFIVTFTFGLVIGALDPT